MRRLFYAAVVVVALYGTATGAVAAFDLPWWIAIGGIFALELGGVTFLSNADVRRRLGEHATASRGLGGIIAAAAAMFNIVTHGDRLLGGFYALMSVLGFVSWWLDVENKRRDRLRTRGLLPAPTPKYELWGHWIRHPMITAQARGLAKAHPQLGLYGSLEAALIVRRREQRDAALADALRSRIRAAAGKKMAAIAVLTYDMDEVARRLRANADYDGLTALLGSELTAEHVLHGRDDQAAVAARAFLAQQTGTPLPPTEAAAGTGEPISPTDPDEAARSDNTSPQHGVPDDTITPEGDSPQRALLAVDSHRHPKGVAVNGTTALPQPGTRPGAPPRRPPTRGMMVPLMQPDGSRGPERMDAPAPPVPQANTTIRSSRTSDPSYRGRVRVTVLGEPAVLDAAGQPIRGLRAKSMELLVFLIVRREGAALGDILDTVWPDVPVQKANQRLSTCLSNLRGIIRGVLNAINPTDPDGTRPEPIVNTGGHYHLDPAIVSVDWWQLLDEQQATLSSASDEIVSAARARIADGYDYRFLS
ncbi:hypothetical protein ABZ541_23870 [Micromonospora sediminicola]